MKLPMRAAAPRLRGCEPGGLRRSLVLLRQFELLSPKSAMSLRVPPSAATNRLSTSWVETSPLSIWETRATDTPIRTATCSWVSPRRLRISASRQPRASSSIEVTAASS